MDVYHGSKLRQFVSQAVALLTKPYKKIKRRLRHNSSLGVDLAVSDHLRQMYHHLEHREIDQGLDYALRAAAMLESSEDHSIINKVGKRLISLGAAGQGTRLIMNSERRRFGERTWTGEDIAARTLLIEWPADHLKGDIGLGLACLSYVAAAARRAKRCIVTVEPRLVPLYRRTIEHADIRSSESSSAVREEADVLATFHVVEAIFGNRPRGAENFVPMQPDRDLVKEFRQRYKSGAGSAQKIIGISWGSKVRARACPEFANWAEFMQACPATYVSLQYGKVSAAVRRIRAMSGASLLHDSSVDQLKDMDRFAAQVASLDLVVSINNTIAHTAGALAVPTIVILGNSYTDWHIRASRRGGWSDRSDRYPNTVLVRKDGRSWNTVMDEVRSHVSSLL